MSKKPRSVAYEGCGAGWVLSLCGGADVQDQVTCLPVRPPLPDA